VDHETVPAWSLDSCECWLLLRSSLIVAARKSCAFSAIYASLWAQEVHQSYNCSSIVTKGSAVQRDRATTMQIENIVKLA